MANDDWDDWTSTIPPRLARQRREAPGVPRRDAASVMAASSLRAITRQAAPASPRRRRRAG